MALLLSVAHFGMISVAASSYFQPHGRGAGRGLPADPAAGAGRRAAGCWNSDSAEPAFGCSYRYGAAGWFAWRSASACCCGTSRRLLYPPDVGSEGKEVVDEEQESARPWAWSSSAISFPTGCSPRPSAPTCWPTGPIRSYDKEMRSEIFSQGTLMLRLVIQVSMCWSMPLMAVCLYFYPSESAPGTSATCVLFNMLVGPGVFGRQHHQRARAANAGTAAGDHAVALADLWGQAAFRACAFRAC